MGARDFLWLCLFAFVAVCVIGAFIALAEEVGEVAASLTYDNAQGTGHNADTIAEVVQVGALALAWLTRYQDDEEN